MFAQTEESFMKDGLEEGLKTGLGSREEQQKSHHQLVLEFYV